MLYLYNRLKVKSIIPADILARKELFCLYGLSMLDTQLRKAFGLRLRALRKQHNWTQKELAAKLNILFSQLNKYECGINVPPPEKLLEMAALFHTNVDYLLSGSPALAGVRRVGWIKAIGELPVTLSK